MMRRGIFAVGCLGLGAGCLPPPPTCDDGCAAATEDGSGGSTEGPGDGSGTTLPGGSDTVDPDDDGTDSGSDDDPTGSDSDTTGGPTAHCNPIEALTISEEGGHVVGNCAFDLLFDANESYTLSRVALHGGYNDNLLMEAPEGGDGLERLSGVIEYPYAASWRNDIDAEILQSGPAVFRVRIEWEDDPVGDAAFSGRSIYTVIADGRIMRDHFIHLTNDPATPGPAWLVDYVALRADLFTNIEWSGPSAGEADVIPGEAGSPADEVWRDTVDAYACAYNQPSGDVVGMTPYMGSGDWVGPRAARSDTDADNPATLSDSLALQADWHRGMTPLDIGYRIGNSMMFIEAREGDFCEGVAAQQAAYASATQVTSPSGSSAITYVNGDDDGDGFSEGGGYYAFDASTGSMPIVLEVGTGPEIPTALFYLAGLGMADVAGVSINERALDEGEYILQDAEAETHWNIEPSPDPDVVAGLYVLLGQAIDTGDQVTITLN